MGKINWTYEGCIHLGDSNTLTGIYLEKLGWVWDKEEEDYTTYDRDLLEYTAEIDSSIGVLCFVGVDDEIVSNVLAACNYNDEEELNKELLVQLNTYIEQVDTELSGDIKEEVRQALPQSRPYEYIKHKVDKIVSSINLEDKINRGIANTEWDGSKSEFVDIIRRGLEVTTLIVQKKPTERIYKYRVLQEVNSTIRKELHNNGYTVGQAWYMVKGLSNEINELVNNRRWDYGDYELELKLLIVPIGLNGFDEGDRLHILTGNTYQYLKSNNIVY